MDDSVFSMRDAEQRYYESIATPFEWRFTKDDVTDSSEARFPRVSAGRRRVAKYVAALRAK
jgi:hypothetical protein